MKMKARRILSLLLALLMAGSVLAGCAAQKSEGSAGSAQSASAPAAASTAPASAGSTSNTKLDEVTLTWYINGNGPQADTEKVEDAVYEYLKDTLNVRLKFVECDWGSYDEKMRMAIASGEPFDICFTAPWSNNFQTNVAKNAYLELDDLLDKYGQGIKETLPDYCWEAASSNGHIYGIPNYQIWAYQSCVVAATSYLDKYNFDLSTVNKLEDLEPLLAAIKADHPDMYPIANANADGIFQEYWAKLGYVFVSDDNLPAVVKMDGTEVLNFYEQPSVVAFYKLMRDWNQKGYFRSDSATVSSVLDDIKSGKSVVNINGHYMPGIETTFKERYNNQPVTIQPLMDPIMTTASVSATMTAISRTSKNPERAMMFLNAVNTDPVLYNLLCFGIEGLDYTTDGVYAYPVENSGYNPQIDWMFGNQFNGLLREGQGKDDWEKTKELNESATQVASFGFTFDSSSLTNELASIYAVLDEFLPSLHSGSVDVDSTLAQMNEKLKTAGSDKLIAEAQKQLDAWKASKK